MIRELLGVYMLALSAQQAMEVPSPNARRPRLYHTMSGGRFGNIVFEFASTYGLARSTGHEAAFTPTFLGVLGQVFELNVTGYDIPTGTRVVEESPHPRRQPSLLPESIPPGQDVHVVGFLQVPQYFTPYEEELRQMLKIKPSLVDSTQTFLNAALEKYYSEGLCAIPETATDACDHPVTYVGIHVRIGDLDRMHRLFNTATEGYLKNAMQYFKNKYHNVLFIACSDTQSWVETTFKKYPDVIVLPPAPFPVHFTALTLCNHTIMSVGTFGWWAAWLAGGDTVYVSRPVEEGYYMAANFAALYIPDWIPIDN